MKNWILLLLTFVAALVISGCEPETLLFIDEAPLSFPETGGIVTVNLVANKNWSVSCDQSWCSVSPSSGGDVEGGIKLSVTCTANPGYDDRACTITIVCEDLSKTIQVKQSQKGVVVIDKTQYDLSYEAQNLQVSLLENTSYEVKIDTDSQGWIKKVGTKGLNTSSFTLSIDENENKAREGVVYVTTSSDIISLKIKQESGILVALDANAFPDANFRQYCIDNFDKNGDDVLSHKEAIDVTRIAVNTGNIYSLQGIEYFNNLLTLICEGGWMGIQNNQLGKITTLDISNNLKLQALYCDMNELADLDVTRNTELIFLSCRNNDLKSIDVSKNSKLTHLDFSNNQLTNINLANNVALERIDCQSNQLKTMDVTKCTALYLLDCQGNKLTSLDVSNNPALTGLLCSNNQLTTLDVSNNTSLTSLGCSYNQLTALDVSKNTALTYLACHANQLTSLDVSRNTALTYLSCYSNQLTNLDVSRNTELKELYCSNNKLTNFDVSRNTLLGWLECYNATMTDLYLASGQSFVYSYWYSGTTVHYGVSLENGHEWVDLGLPSGLKWATCNVGASLPSDYGGYFAWGEISTKTRYDWGNLKYRLSGDSYDNVTFAKYNIQSERGTVDNKTHLELSDDAARQNWGGSWRMPTISEFWELRDSCTWTWTTQDGTAGYKVTSKTNGNSIFLPAAGYSNNAGPSFAGIDGCYWTTELMLDNTREGIDIYFDSGGVYNSVGHRCLGESVRPVTE